MAEPARLSFPPIEPAGAGRKDPIINALIEKLPAPGSQWPAAERAAWLHMMETAFVMAYGSVERAAMTAQRSAPAVPSKRTATKKTKPKRPARAAKAGPAKVTAQIQPEFYIDMDGTVRQAGGNRVLPEDVNDDVYDKRGEGDLGTIQWADGTFGVKGLQINIVAWKA